MQNFWKWLALLVAVGGGGFAVFQVNEGLQQIAERPAAEATPAVAEAAEPTPQPTAYADLVPTPAVTTTVSEAQPNPADVEADPFAEFDFAGDETLAADPEAGYGASVPVNAPATAEPQLTTGRDPEAEFFAAAGSADEASDIRGQSPDAEGWTFDPQPAAETIAAPSDGEGLQAGLQALRSRLAATEQPAPTPQPAQPQPAAPQASYAELFDQAAAQSAAAGLDPAAVAAAADQMTGAAAAEFSAGVDQLRAAGNQLAQTGQQFAANLPAPVDQAGTASIDMLGGPTAPSATSTLPSVPGSDPNPFAEFAPSEPGGANAQFAAEMPAAPRPEPAAATFGGGSEQFAQAPQPTPGEIVPASGDQFAIDANVPTPANFDFGPTAQAPQPQPSRARAMQPQPAPAPQPSLDSLGGFDPSFAGVDAAASPQPAAERFDNRFEVRSQPMVRQPEPQPQPTTQAAIEPELKDEFIGRATIDREVTRGPVQPELQILKQAPKKASFGEPMIYQINVRNVGRSPANRVVVEDRVPKGAELLGTNPRGTIADGIVTWEFDRIDPSKEEIIRVKIRPIASGQIGSITTVRMVAETAAETIVTAPELGLKLTGPNEAQLGDIVTYEYEITNTGSEDAHEVVLASMVPKGLAHSGGPDINYEVGTLKAGETRVVPLPLRAVETGKYTKQVTLSARGGISESAQQPIAIIESRLAISRSGPRKRFVGSRTEFLNTIANNSSKTLRNVRVVEELPAGAEFVSATQGGRPQAGGRSVVWMIPSIAPGATRELACTIVPKSPGSAGAIVKAESQDGSRAQVQSEMTVIGFASLKIDTEHPNRQIAVGEQVPMRVKIRNGGSAAAHRVGVSVTVPEHLRIIEAKGPGGHQVQGDQVLFDSIAQIDPGQAPEIYLLVEAQAEGDKPLRLQMQSDESNGRPQIHEEVIGSYSDESYTR